MLLAVVTRLSEQETAWATIILLTLMGAAWLLSVLPSCSEPDCANAHAKHRVAARAVAIEKEHITFHDRLRPQPKCALCQAAKRIDDEP